MSGADFEIPSQEEWEFYEVDGLWVWFSAGESRVRLYCQDGHYWDWSGDGGGPDYLGRFSTIEEAKAAMWARYAVVKTAMGWTEEEFERAICEFTGEPYPEPELDPVDDDEEFEWTQPTYPYLVIRHMPTVYQEVEIGIVESTELESASPSSSAQVKVEIRDAFVHGALRPGARDVVIEVVWEMIRRLKKPMCVVFGPADCAYLELDGSMNLSDDPPSGGMVMTRSSEGEQRLEPRGLGG